MNSGGGGEIWAGWRKTVEWLAGIDWIEGMWFRVDGDGAVRFYLRPSSCDVQRLI